MSRSKSLDLYLCMTGPCDENEYVHPTPGVDGPGPQRIVVGKCGEMYYTADHYEAFISIAH